MADNQYDVDPALLAEFIDESEEALGSLDSLFVQLEAEPANLDIIGSIFRPVHTVKGNSAFFGLMKVKVLAHEMETLLDLARKGQLVPSEPIISVLLTGVDRLKDMMDRARSGQPEIDDEAGFEKLLQQVITARDGEDTTALWEQLLAGLSKLQDELAAVESAPTEQIEAVLTLAQSLAPEQAASSSGGGPAELLERIDLFLNKADAGPLSPTDAAQVAKALTELKAQTTGAEAAGLLDEALDDYKTFMGSVGFDPLLADLVRDKVQAVVSLGAWTQPAADETPAAEPGANTATPPPRAAAKPVADTKKTMRIPEESIDNFLGFVGELIVVGEMFGHLQNRLVSQNLDHSTTADFRQVNDTFSALSNNLRKSIMEIRMVPVKAILQKVPRMIRDVAAESGKLIAVEIVGEQTEIDKSLVDTLEAPLTHMVRNAADHGIDLPDEREAAGKPRQGNVRVAVTETENDIVLSIADDGKGLDFDAIRTKAVSLGMIGPEAELTQSDIIDLLFRSGVSTAKEVTDISGRGVGMDVVKSKVESIGGKITVSSTPGQGSEFRVYVPKTVSTQIMEGFIIRLGPTCYVLPLERIRETFRPQPEEVSTVIEKGECVLRHGHLLPVISLAKLFGESNDYSVNSGQGIMIALDSGRRRIALFVDDVIGVQQVVIKPLEGLRTIGDLVVGGAVMGDGTVAVVLDPDHLIQAVLAVPTH